MPVRTIAAAASGLALLALSLTACGGNDEVKNTPDDLIIGVSSDRPGLSVVNSDGSFSGFDVDLASYLAKGLGWNERDIRFKAIDDDEREGALSRGDVDMVVDEYAMTPEREKVVDFAGPYFIAGQDLLVTKNSRLTGASSLGGQSVCGVDGSPELDRVATQATGVDVQKQPTLDSCVDLLLSGSVDAVTADDLVLAGYAQQHPGDIKVVGSPFTTSYYGVGLPSGSPDVAVVNDLLVRAINDGTWQADFERHFGSSGFALPLPPAPGSSITDESSQS